MTVPDDPAHAAPPDRLEAGLLTLVRWHPDHVDAMLAAIDTSFPELRLWMDWAQAVPTRDELSTVVADGIESFAAGTDINHVLIETASDEIVGRAGIHRRIGPGAVEIGYWVRSDRHRRGYATAAAGALVQAAFEHLPDVERVEIHTDRANVASAGVARKLGFRHLRSEPQEKLALAQTDVRDIWELTNSTPT